MPDFVLNRTYVLAGSGHMIRFEKGQPTYVPPELVKAAVGIGAEPADGNKPDVLDPEEQEKVPLTPQEKQDELFAAFEILIERNDSKEFDGAGKPTIDALKPLIEFSVTKKDILAAWQKFKESKEQI